MLSTLFLTDMGVSQGSPEKQTADLVYIHTHTCSVFILRNRFMQLWGLASLSFAGWAARLEIPAGGDLPFLSLKAVWRQNSFLFEDLILFS